MSDENLIRLYTLLLKKYQKLINKHETKTVGDIKALINKKDLTIQSFIQKFIPEKYFFEKDYLHVLNKIYNYIVKEISFVKIDFDLNFWLTPGEILKYKVSEDEDIAVFLCSVMEALFDQKAFVLILELENIKSHAVVITEFKNQFILLDPSQRQDFAQFIGEKEKVLEKYSFQNQKIKGLLYKFNSREYEQFF